MTFPVSLELSFAEKFEKERYGRLIAETSSVTDLRKMAKDFLDLYFSQKAAARYAWAQSLLAPPSFTKQIPSPESRENIQQEDAQRQHDSDQPEGQEDPAGQRPGLQA